MAFVPGAPQDTRVALLTFRELLLERPAQPADWYNVLPTALHKPRARIVADASSAPATKA